MVMSKISGRLEVRFVVDVATGMVGSHYRTRGLGAEHVWHAMAMLRDDVASEIAALPRSHGHTGGPRPRTWREGG
jgi:hypothetical protein